MRRCVHEIFRVILKEARNGTRPTPLMFAARTTYPLLRRYLETLNDKGLVEKKGKKWFTTEKGMRYLNTLEALRLLEDVQRT